MVGNSLAFASLEDAARLLRARKVSSVELTRLALERAEALQGRLHAFITLTPDQALAAARRADREFKAGDVAGPLRGIPMSIKDLYDTKGITTTAGSKVYAARVPQ